MSRIVQRCRVVAAGIALATASMWSSGAHAQSGAVALTPQAVVDELLAADRGFSARGANTDLVTSLSAMFADAVMMPAPPGRFAKGKAEVVAAFTANADLAQSRAQWAPLRAGVSGDALHGFTLGLMTITRSDGTTSSAKYLSYWIKSSAGWRVAVYRRVPQPDGAVATAMLPPALPERIVAPITNATMAEQGRATLIAAERAFSDLAQRIGLGPAFKECGTADAINLGGQRRAGVVIGNEAIAKMVQGDAPIADGQVSWSADDAIVASSGDLGVTMGFIKPNGQTPGQTAGFPFFTVWRKVVQGGPGSGTWKYVAE